MSYSLLNAQALFLIFVFLLGGVAMCFIPTMKIPKKFSKYTVEQWTYTQKNLLPFYGLVGATFQYALFSVLHFYAPNNIFSFNDTFRYESVAVGNLIGFTLFSSYIFYFLRDNPPCMELNLNKKTVLTNSDLNRLYIEKVKIISKICFFTVLLDTLLTGNYFSFIPIFTLIGIFPTWCVIQGKHFSKRKELSGKHFYAQVILHCFPPTFIATLWFTGCCVGGFPFFLFWIVKSLLTGGTDIPPYAP